MYRIRKVLKAIWSLIIVLFYLSYFQYLYRFNSGHRFSEYVKNEYSLSGMNRSKYEIQKLKGCDCGRKQKVTNKGNPDLSLCSASATARGGGQKVISYVFFGPPDHLGLHKEHFLNIVNITKRAKIVYPDWSVRLHLENSSIFHHPKVHPVLCELFCSYTNLDICILDDLHNNTYNSFTSQQINGRFWRFLPLLDPLVDVFVSRDIDAYILDREVAAVSEWLQSRYSYHIMRDHPSHGGAILAGLWGVKTSEVREKHYNMWRDYIYSHAGDERDLDQSYLSQKIYPHITSDLIQHDSYFCQRSSFPAALKRPFSVKRDVEYNWCGGGLNYNMLNILIKEHPCPEVCRPVNHSDWLYC